MAKNQKSYTPEFKQQIVDLHCKAGKGVTELSNEYGIPKGCTGCGACQNSCPKKCILMESDNCGFAYPAVDKDKCVECGRCMQVCPVLKNEVVKNELKEVYAGWSLDSKNRWESTSGGIFYELCKSIFHKFGKEEVYICAAEYDRDMTIRHSIYSEIKDIAKFRQSKYAQSKIGNCYNEIKDLLAQGNIVLFCGTPCQVAGLRQTLNKDYENLFTVDFICRGVNSPKAYNKWLEEIEKKEKANVVGVWFKYKEHGWKKSPMCTLVELDNKKQVLLEGTKNYYMQGYLGPNLYIRPSCGECKFKGVERWSDITLGDFWGIEAEKDDDKGTSLIMVNSIKGKVLLDNLENDIALYEKDVNAIISGNECFKSSIKINPKSESFLLDLDDIPFSKCVKRYSKSSILYKIIRKLRIMRNKI